MTRARSIAEAAVFLLRKQDMTTKEIEAAVQKIEAMIEAPEPLTVAKLIEELKAMPPDAKVWVHSYDDSNEASSVRWVLEKSSTDSTPGGAVRIE